jgi:hypothetical protein
MVDLVRQFAGRPHAGCNDGGDLRDAVGERDIAVYRDGE